MASAVPLMTTLDRYINSHNQSILRCEMTEQHKDVIRAAGPKENTLPVRLRNEKMKREHIYAIMATFI